MDTPDTLPNLPVVIQPSIGNPYNGYKNPHQWSFTPLSVGGVWLSLTVGQQLKKEILSHIWVFPKIGVPQNGWFIMENPIKNGMIWGEFSAIHIHIQPSHHPPHVPIKLEELCIEIGIQVSRADKWSRPYRVSCVPYQWLFLVPLIGGRYHIIPQLAVYTTYIPLTVYIANWVIIWYLPPIKGTRKLHWPWVPGRWPLNFVPTCTSYIWMNIGGRFTHISPVIFGGAIPSLKLTYPPEQSSFHLCQEISSLLLTTSRFTVSMSVLLVFGEGKWDSKRFGNKLKALQGGPPTSYK